MDTVVQLAKPLKMSQIKAASEFWSEGWESPEYEQLRKAFPGRDEAVSIKAIVVNQLYGTNVIAIEKVADRVEQVLKGNHSTGPDLVEELVVKIREVTKRHNYSFAAKYAHFFIDSSLPVLDSYAEWLVGKHLGKLQSKKTKRYHKFFEDIETLIRVADLNCDCSELDAYLWVAGEYWWWKEHPKTQINADLQVRFEKVGTDPNSDQKLVALLGLEPASLRPLIEQA